MRGKAYTFLNYSTKQINKIREKVNTTIKSKLHFRYRTFFNTNLPVKPEMFLVIN